MAYGNDAFRLLNCDAQQQKTHRHQQPDTKTHR